MVPDRRVLSGAAYAFDGRWSSIADGIVTLTPTQWYAGEPTDLVEVDQGSRRACRR